MQKNPVRRHASSLALVIAAAAIMLAAAIVRAQEVESHYWDLGVGAYGSLSGSEDTWSNTTDLDKARMDWLTINFGSYTVNPDVYNRQLRLNPRLKYLVRLWPINNLGWKENRYKATFLDYLYKPGVKEKLLAETSPSRGTRIRASRRPQTGAATPKRCWAAALVKPSLSWQIARS